MDHEQLTENEVDEYLARIHFTGPREPTLKVLTELQRCHMLSVPFENLSVFGKEKIVMSKDWLFDKIVRRHRGGFCCELNTLYSLLLDSFGFRRKLFAGAVFMPGRKGIPFDHMFHMINFGDDLWLTDVGFGDSYLSPLRLSDSPDPQERESGIYRIRKDGEEYWYEEKVKEIVDKFGHEKQRASTHDEWEGTKKCKFDLTPKAREDFNEMLIHHQTNPESPFTHDRICSIAMPWGRVTLAGSKVVTSTYLGDNKVRKEIKELQGGEEEIVKELEQKFGIRREAYLYPEGSMFYGIDWSKATS